MNTNPTDTGAWPILAETESLCPECLRRLPARYADDPTDPDTVWLIKRCPEHGGFRVPVWRGEPRFTEWRRPKIPARPNRPKPASARGCPYDCGLCENHRQNTCCALLEVTRRCNLLCPLCYASSGGDDPDPTREELGRLLDSLIRQSGPCNLQLSGGEPTVRDDLPEIIAMARRKGLPFIQLNTNGLRLGVEKGYADRLAAAGLATVYLQFDSLDAGQLKILRGRDCLTEKTAAIRAAAAAGLGVVLVMTLAPEVNRDQIGPVLRFALEQGTGVRGLHIQPAAAFGRHPWTLGQARRITLPEVMRELETQSGGMARATDFHPPGGEHALCSFSALYERMPDGGIALIRNAENSCCRGGTESAAEGVRKAKAFTALHWRGYTGRNLADDGSGFERILRDSGLDRRFTISAMAFLDALTVDMERLKGCYIHVVDPDGALVPFCAYNMTARDGRALHRGNGREGRT